MDKKVLHGRCDVCQNEFSRALNSKVENEFGISRRLKDVDTPAKVVCASSDCKAKAVKINKAYRNAKNPERNKNYNNNVEALYEGVSARFDIVRGNNTLLYPTLILLTLKVARDRHEPCTLLRMLRSFLDPSVNRKIIGKDDKGWPIYEIGLVQTWHTFCKKREFKLSELFRKSNPIRLPDAPEYDYYSDKNIDVVFRYLMDEDSNISVDDFLSAVKPHAPAHVKSRSLDFCEIYETPAPFKFSFTTLNAQKMPVGKKFSQNGEGDLIDIQQEKAFVLSQPFIADTVEMDSLSEFADYLNSTTAYNYAMYSVSNHTSGMHTITTIKDAERYSIDKDNTFSRTKRNYSYQPKPGILWFDFDDISSFQDTLDNLFKVAPELSGYSYIWQPSASANVSRGNNQLSGETGLHVYFVVDDMTNAAKIAATVNKRAVIAGITTPGHTLVDPAALTPTQLDSVCSAVPQTGFHQDRNARLVEGRTQVVNSQQLMDLNPVENARYLEIMKAHKAASKVAVSGSEIAPRHVMTPDAVVKFKDNTSASVADIIRSPFMYRNKDVICPITGKGGKAKLFVNPNGSIVIHTKSNSGVSFMLYGDNVNNRAANTDAKIVTQKASGKSRILRG